jgi:hypothetical protein
MMWPVTSQSSSIRSAAKCCFIVGGVNGFDGIVQMGLDLRQLIEDRLGQLALLNVPDLVISEHKTAARLFLFLAALVRLGLGYIGSDPLGLPEND